jgi:NADH:ubiquinone reductase (H+-translocating)
MTGHDGSEAATRHRVVVVGGGFGGLQAVRELRHAALDVTLIDRRNFHLFQPLLYQVATGALSPGEIAAPLRHVFRREGNVSVLLGEVTGLRSRRAPCPPREAPECRGRAGDRL